MSRDSQLRIFVVEDNDFYRELLKYNLSLVPEYEVSTFATGKELLNRLHEHPQVITLDYSLPDYNGDELLKKIRAQLPDVPVVVISNQEDVRTAVELMRNGAYDYIFKDAPYKELVARVIEGLRSRRSLEREVMEHRARRSLDQPLVRDMVGDSSAMTKFRDDLRAVVVGSDKFVLVLGPTGVGKELVVRAIHALGPHPDAPFIARNCSAIPESLFESELFGHEEHAFTGAKRRPGALGATGKGTLFLDEIGEMPPFLQAKLLRVL